MKLSEKAKKRLILAGLGVVCVILVIAISSQFKTVQPEDEAILPSSTVSDNIGPGNEIPTPSADPANGAELNVGPIDPTAAPTSPADTGDSSGTEQSLQAEPTKPEAPAETPAPQDNTAVTNPAKPPEYKPEDTVKTTEPSSPKAGDKNDKGQVWFPGFGWVDDEGGGVNQEEVGSDGDIDKQVGNMD